jgi:hypothetical protein
MFLSFDTRVIRSRMTRVVTGLHRGGPREGFQNDRAAEGTFRYQHSALSAILFLTPSGSAWIGCLTLFRLTDDVRRVGQRGSWGGGLCVERF